MGLTSLVLLLIPSFGVALAADVIDVWTKESYEPGDKVKVEGYTNVTGTVTVIITNSTGYEILSLTDDPDAKGEFLVDFPLGEDASAGTYEVNATVGSIYNTTSFEVVAESDGGEETMNLEDLLSAIERAFRFIEKVNATAMALQEEDYDMELFWEKLNGLNESLTELYENIDLENVAASVEDFRDLRKEISQLSGLLSSITKNVKQEKAWQFTERMRRQIRDLEGKIEGLGESAGVDEFRSNLEAYERKLERLWLTLNTTILHDELEVYLKELEGVTQGVDSGFDGLGDEGHTLKEMYTLQARIEVFNATVKRMDERGKDMNKLREKLGNAEQLMEQMQHQFNEKNWGKMKGTIDDANESLRGVGKTIRDMNRSNNGGNGKGNGNK
ncbi:MAG: hypothetical protein OEZ44_00510 [Candidatus Bathyarchaeota archaeon]|nr:hypothetical protein [Candidatus Bathyarchaeota archaeon]